MGDESGHPGASLEVAIATTWLVRVGIVALVAGVAYFLKWTIDRRLLGPFARVAICVAFGLAQLAASRPLLGKRYRLLGEAFLGGGLATFYFSVFALGPLYRLVDSTPLVFALMGLVTVAAGGLSLRSNSLLAALVGCIGGFCTPLMLREHDAHLATLLAYLLLLNLGVFAISRQRGWRLLNYLGFLFTYGAYAVSMERYTRTDFPVVIGFLTLFFLIHSTLVFTHNVRHRIPCTVLEILHLTLNAGIYAWVGGMLVHEAHGRPVPAVLTFGVGLFYAAHAQWCVRRQIRDKSLLLTVIALAAFYTTLTMPLALEREPLTVAWALQAYLFLCLGHRLGSRFLGHLAYALYAFTLARLALFEFPNIGVTYRELPADWSHYGRILADRAWTFGAAIAALVAGQRSECAAAETGPDGHRSSLPDIAGGIPATIVSHLFFWVATAVVFLYLHCELHVLFSLLRPWGTPVLTGLWGAAAVFFAWRHRTSSATGDLRASTLFAVGMVVKSCTWDFGVWRLAPHLGFLVPYRWPTIAARVAGFAAVVAALTLLWRFHRTRERSRAAAWRTGYAALACLWLFSTFEVITLLQVHLRSFSKGGLSVWWTLFALGLLAGGIAGNERPLRYVALALFGTVIVKVFLHDLDGTPIILRVAALGALGALLLLGAFAYLRGTRVAPYAARDEHG